MQLNIFRLIGGAVLAFLGKTGIMVLFMVKALLFCFLPPYYLRILLGHIRDIGYYSLPVVGMTSLFAGMVLALQSYSGVSSNLAEQTIPSLVVLAITRELAPVLAGLMVAGRVGAAIAAEIGTMRVSEQIDALETLSTDPFHYLIAPRVIAAIISLPLLVMVGDVIGVLGGYLVGVYQLGFNDALYLKNTISNLQWIGVISGLVKAAVFGLIIALMGCFHGYHSQGGAQGVGAATTYAVVSASILILIFNYIVTMLFFGA